MQTIFKCLAFTVVYCLFVISDKQAVNNSKSATFVRQGVKTDILL